MKNIFINLTSASAKSVSVIQILSLIIGLIGLIHFNVGLYELSLIILGYFLFSGFGVSLMMHRYYSHKSFEFKYKFLENLGFVLAVLSGRGSIIGWVYIHRMHHAFSDTNKDPHNPTTSGWKIFFPHLLHYGEKLDKKIIKDFFVYEHLMVNRYYNLIILSFALILFLISPKLLVFFYAIPLFLTALALDLFVFLSHTYGYRNFDTRDNSKNNWFISLILWGEGWHNNHHANAKNHSLQVKWYEIDILSYFIKLIKR